MIDLLPQLRVDASKRFQNDFAAIQKATPRRERIRDEAWVTDYSTDSDICLGRKVLEGVGAEVVYRMGEDYKSEMVAAVPTETFGVTFRAYVKGPDDVAFHPQPEVTELEAGMRFLGLLERAEVALLQ